MGALSQRILLQVYSGLRFSFCLSKQDLLNCHKDTGASAEEQINGMRIKIQGEWFLVLTVCTCCMNLYQPV